MKVPDPGRQNTEIFAGWSRLFSYGVLQSILALSFYVASSMALVSGFSLEYGLLIVIGTLGIYNGHLIVKTLLEVKKLPYVHILLLLLLSILAFIVLFNFRSGREYLKHLLVPVIISILYLIPFSRIIPSKFIPGWIKPISLAISWTWICVGPVHLKDNYALFFIGSIFFLILANALMFDVKDIVKDKLMNKSTFANKYGWEITRKTAFLNWLISIFLFGLFCITWQSGIWICIFIPVLYYFPLSKIKTDSPPNQYYWYLDGGLFLFPGAVILMHLLSRELNFYFNS